MYMRNKNANGGYKISQRMANRDDNPIQYHHFERIRMRVLWDPK
jgi:hypothetical protein